MRLFAQKKNHNNGEQRYLNRIAWFAQCIWAVLLLTALAIQHYQSNQVVLALAHQSAMLSFAYNDSIRLWNLKSDGVYLAMNEAGPHQVVTNDGLRLQRTVPAQMVSQIQRFLPQDSIKSKITSLNPINPVNAADPWERAQLQKEQPTFVAQLTRENGKEYYRTLHPIHSEDQCYSCHDHRLNSRNDTDGALSVRVPLQPIKTMLRTKVIGTTVSLFLLWLLGCIGITTMTRSLITRIHARDKAQRQLSHGKNLYSALSATNQAIAKQLPKTQLFQEVCDIAIKYAGFKLAWIGMVDSETQQVQPVARAGSMCDYIDEINVSIDPLRPEGRGPTSVAIRENKAVIISNFLQELRGTIWHDPAQRNGIRSSAAYPICSNGVAIGALKVYADQTDFFSTELNELMQQMANDLSLAIDNLEQQRQLKHSQTLNQTLIDALPYPALLSRYSDKRVITANRKAVEMGFVVGEVNHFSQPPDHQEGKQFNGTEEQHKDGRWEMIYWCPVEDSDDNDIYLHFAVDITDKKKQELDNG